ncbi:MAG: MFS transporter [Chloroflexi bacterium]|nr:MFS transporter [Chloroflexota bacterium]
MMAVHLGRKRNVYHGWWMVLAGASVSTYVTGVFYWSFGAFFDPILATFGWSRTVASTGYAMHRLVGGVLGPFIGRLLDRLGPRPLMLGGLGLLGAGYLVMATTRSLPMFYIAFLVISVGLAAGTFNTLYVSVANWFTRRRGRALGILTLGGALGGLLAPAIVWLIEHFGWRWAVAIAGLGVWVVGFPAAMVMRRRPEDGQVHEGGVSTTPAAGIQPNVQVPKEPVWTTRQLMRSRPFWFLSLGLGIEGFMTSALFLHQIPGLVGFGLTPVGAAMIVTLSTLLSIPGRLAGGLLADLVDKRLVMTGAYLLQSLGGLVFAGVHTWWQAVTFATLVGIGFGVAEPTRTATVADYFGRRSLGAVLGTMSAVTAVTGVAGPVAAGWLADQTGNYRVAFLVLSLISLVSVPWFLLMGRPVGAWQSRN